MNLLEVQDLKKYFDTNHGTLHAVDGISFCLQANETLGVVGESGCGKSTLGRTLLHLLEPTSGTISFCGEDITAPSRERLKELRGQMQMIFQDPYASINPRMTVEETIMEPLQLYKLCHSQEEYHRQALEIMDIVGLAKRYANTYPHELDGGRRQRIGIGRAIALDPQFIVCDEPVSALDVSIQAQVLNLMQDLQRERGISYIFITHDLSVVRHISDQIMVMYLGCCMENAPADALFAHQYHPYTQALLSAIPQVKKEKRRARIIMKGEITSPIDPPDGCRFAPRCPHATDLCRSTTPQLTEVAPHHTVACHFAGRI